MSNLSNLHPALVSAISLLIAFGLGALIGFERQYRQRTAGLRTNVLVSVGAAAFVNIGLHLAGHPGAISIISYIVSGIGFLGAGVIMREEGNVRGINTAATLWGSAAVGATAGSGLYAEATVATLFVLAANTLLRPIVNSINSKPLSVNSVEVTTMLYVIADRGQQKRVLGWLENEFELREIAITHLAIHPFGQSEIEIEATLDAAKLEESILDELVTTMLADPDVHQAFWSPSLNE